MIIFYTICVCITNYHCRTCMSLELSRYLNMHISNYASASCSMSITCLHGQRQHSVIENTFSAYKKNMSWTLQPFICALAEFRIKSLRYHRTYRPLKEQHSLSTGIMFVDQNNDQPRGANHQENSRPHSVFVPIIHRYCELQSLRRSPLIPRSKPFLNREWSPQP